MPGPTPTSAVAVTAAAPTGAPARDRGARRTVGGTVAAKGAEMVTLAVLATAVPRVLGPGAYGRFALALTVVTLGTVAMLLGGPTLMARYVPAVAPEDQPGVARALGLALARWRVVHLAIIAAVALGLVAWDPVTFPPLVVALVVVALAASVAATLALQTALGLGRTGPWNARFPLQNTVMIVAVLIGQALAGSTGAIAGIVVGAVVALTLGLVAVAPLAGVDDRSVALPDGALRFATLQAVSGALVQVAHRGGIVVVALIAGSATQTGYTALALGVALAVTYAVVQAFTVSLPRLAARAPVAEGASANSWRSRPTSEVLSCEAALRRLAGAALVVLVPVAIALAPVLEGAVVGVFGGDYAAASTAFAFALAMVVLAPINALGLQAAALRVRPGTTLASAIASVVAFILVAVLTVGAHGAAGGTAAALAGAAAAAATTVVVLPGAVGSRIATASFAGAGLVLALSLVA